MPELPEVETVVRTLRPTLLGSTICEVSLLRADVLQPQGADLPAALAGRSIRAIDRRGKKILLRLDNDWTLAIHLGMTGQLTTSPPDAPLKPHTHLILRFHPSSRLPHPSPELHFRDPRRFGGLWLLPPSDPGDSALGPEPLSLRPNQLLQRLSKTKRPIKSALLDQSLIAGLGNIYVDESLHHAHIHPLTPAHQLTPQQVSALNRSIKLILNRAIRNRGSSLRDYVDATGLPGNAQSLHQVYNRANQPCPTCQTPISRIVLTGRSTHFCPHCQPLSVP